MIKKVVSTLFLLIFSWQAHALLTLELTHGMKAAVPIAVVPFDGESDLDADYNISQIISLDLNNTGQFTIYDNKKLPSTPNDVGAIKLSNWRGLGVEDVVVGNVKQLASGQYQVVVSLVDVFQSTNSDKVPAKSVLFSKMYTVNKTQLRALAHHISNIIYQDLTGDPGIFSTKLVYVLVTQKNRTPQYQLMVSDYDGYNPQALISSTQPLMSPSWSPDAKQIAFVSFQKTLPAIYTVEVATGKLTQVTKLAGINGAPAWSPDGDKMALVLSKTGQAKVYIRDLKTGKTTQLTKGFAIDTEPSFSPDGKDLLFTSNRGGGPQIYQYDFATKQVERLTYEGKYNATASYSPDGKNIVMLHGEKNQFNIATESLDTNTFRLLARDGLAESPSYSPNGKMIIYATQDKGRNVLALVSSDGEVQLRLPESNGNVQEPDWSPYIG